MGKVRKSRANKNRKNINTDNSEEDEQIETDQSKENVFQTILDQLQVANVEEKYCGLQTLALQIEDIKNIQEVIDIGIVKVVAPLLLDTASPVRNASAGVLRNLSATGHEICDALMDQDVMTPLTCYFHEYTETWVPDVSLKSNNEYKDTFMHCMNLLLNLCESSELAVKYLGQSNILDWLPRFLDIRTFDGDIVVAVLKFFFVIVEDNPLVVKKITGGRELNQLLALEGNEPLILLIKTLAVGVIINTHNGNICPLPLEITNQIISILANTLSVDHRLACNQLSSNVPLSDNAGKVEAPKGKTAQVLESQLKSVLQILDAQQSSVEIVANICSCDDGDSSFNGDESSDSDDFVDEELCNNGENSILAEDKLPIHVMEALISLEIFDKIWARTQLPAENVMMILKEYEGSQLIYKKIQNLQTRALLCVNNMISSLPIESLGDVDGVYKVWVDAGKLVFKQNSTNLNLLESATAVMRAALDKMKFRKNGNANGANLFNDLALSDIEMMLTGIRECQVPEIRSNLIRMIGLLALLLVNNLNDTVANVVCTITEFILEQSHKETEVWVLAEIIDTLIDLYSEDETDSLAAKVKLVDRLTVLAPILKNKARQQKRLPKEYKVVVSTVVSNLPRFIKYKSKRTNKLQI